MCVVLNEDHFGLHKFSLSNNYTVFVENHNLWRLDCTQWVWLFSECMSEYVMIGT